MKMKKRLTQDEEFQIMKLVLDKFLWLGFGIMAYGLYLMISGATGIAGALTRGLTFLVIGAIVLVVFMVIIIKEYEFLK